MPKKPQKITISWSDENEAMLRQIAEKHGDAMRYNDILPYTNTTGENQPNASGIIRYLLMSATNKVKRLR